MSDPTWTPGRRPLALRALDGMLRVRDRLGLAPAPLAAGLRDPRLDDVATPLRLLAHGFEHEAGLTPVGRALAAGLLHRSVRRRLGIEDALRADPSLADAPVERPVFIAGLPRTGTSLLLNLLALDPASRPLRGWEAFDPLPPRKPPRVEDPRVKTWRRFIRAVGYAAPDYRTVHPLTVDGPEECVALLLRSFVTSAWTLFAHLPAYDDWLWSQPTAALEPTYRLHRLQLQLLQRQGGSGTWLLKSPAHVTMLPALLRVYPDARVICTHRDLAEVLPSVCSLFALTRSVYTDQVDPHVLGREALDTMSKTVARVLGARESLPATRILDVRYENLVRDPLGTLERVLAHLGRTVTPEMEAGVSRHVARTGPHARPAHRYSLAQFGLDRDAVAEMAAPYRDAFLS